MELAKPNLTRRLLDALYQKLDLVGDQRLLVGDDGPPVRNAPAPLPTLLRLIQARLGRNAEAQTTTSEFRESVDDAVRALGDTVKTCRWYEVEAGRTEWLPTGIMLRAGGELTLLSHGMLYLSKPLDVGIGPVVGLWYRVGNSEIRKLPQNQAVIRAETAGELQLMAVLPGEFGDTSGAFEQSIPRKRLQGGYSVAVIEWQLSTTHGLATAARLSADRFAPLLQAYEDPVKPPKGWRYLWRLGEGDIFKTDAGEGAPVLCCDTHRDVGILQYPLDVPFAEDLRLSWSWLMQQLPSALPEHIQPTHDYLSIAIEFDNGLDLTYMWSAELPVDTIFQCPLPWWDQRETHWVVRSGAKDLNRWLDEERNVYEDYRRGISGPLPQRVVAVWLIANSIFQRGQGRCQYRSIVVSSGGEQTHVA